MKADTSEIKKSVAASQSAILAEFISFLEKQNAIDIAVIKLDDASAFADTLIVTSATSRRHAQGLADGMARLCHEKGYEFLGMEGYDGAQWILMDCNDIIVNIFQKDARQLYKLEDLWGGNARLSQEDNNL